MNNESGLGSPFAAPPLLSTSSTAPARILLTNASSASRWLLIAGAREAQAKSVSLDEAHPGSETLSALRANAK